MKSFLCLVVGAGTIASSAIAQRVPIAEKSPRFQQSGPKAGAKDTRRVVQEFARCLARRSMSGVAEYLSQKPGGLTPALRTRAPECLGESFDAGDGSMLKGQADTYRYALAEAYVVRKYREAGVPELSLIAPLNHPGESAGGNRQGLGMLSECIIRGAPGQSWSLLRTDAASAEEKAAFAAIGAAMQSCVQRGKTLNMPAFFVRGAIAQTYYMLSKAPRVAAGGVR